jgi:hypothetical protein
VHIDPKAPRTSPQHPANWRRPDSLAPAASATDAPPAAVAELPEAPATPAAPPPAKKPAPKKKPAGKANLAAALAKLADR